MAAWHHPVGRKRVDSVSPHLMLAAVTDISTDQRARLDRGSVREVLADHSWPLRNDGTSGRSARGDHIAGSAAVGQEIDAASARSALAVGPRSPAGATTMREQGSSSLRYLPGELWSALPPSLARTTTGRPANPWPDCRNATRESRAVRREGARRVSRRLAEAGPRAGGPTRRPARMGRPPHSPPVRLHFTKATTAA